MPKIGMRMIKTAVSVFLCFVVYLLRGEGIPFYSAIAAVLCTQQDLSGSFSVALNRVKGTLLGGAFGMWALLLERAYFSSDQPLLKYLFISFTLIPLILLTVLIRIPAASYIACVVFMSVVVSHGADVNPLSFTINRVIDTLIGIAIALAVNSVHILRRRDRSTLFVASLEYVLAGGTGHISTFGKVKLNQLLESGANLLVLSEESPERFVPMLAGIRLKLPVIAFGGSALYRIPEQAYTSCVTIPRETVHTLERMFSERGRGCLAGAVIDNVLHVFYSQFANEQEYAEYEARRKTNYRQYVCSALPEDRAAIFVSAIEPADNADTVRAAVEALPCADTLSIGIRPCAKDQNWVILEIRAANSTPENAISSLREHIPTVRTTVCLPAGVGDAPIKALARRFHRGGAKAVK